MEGKEYDLLLSLANNGGTTSIVDLVDAGMTTENTSFYDKDTYKKNEDVKKTFTDNEGNFNEKAFDSFYNYAAESYKQMGILQDTKKASESLTGDPKVWNKITEHNALQSATYDEDNFLISDRSKRKNSNQPKWITKVNPEYTMTSMSRGVNLSSESPWSKRELAQMSNAQDSETGEILDKPSFWTLDWRPLVRATYDEDVYDENGNLLHKKGEDKLNEDGHYYYETLGNRSVYGKDLINRWDVITDDRSWLNNIDFFDSDDKHEKNPVGSILKMAALVGSMYIPYVGPFIAGTSVLLQVSSMLGTLGKMVTQDESSYFLNNLEAFAKMYKRDSHTDYASQNPFSSENIVGLVGDVTAQLKEQRWLFEKPAYLFGQEARLGKEYMEVAGGEATEKVIQKTIDTIFKDKFKKNFDEGVRALVKTGNPAEFETYALATKMAEKEAAINFLKNQVKSNMRITSPLSKVYMTFLTTQDAYGEAVQMGIPKEEAVAYAIGYTAAEYFLLSTGVGERILPELHADKIVMRNMLRKIYSDVDAALAETAALHPEKLVGKQSIGNIIQTVKEKSTKVLNSIMPSNLSGLETEGAINFAKVLWGNAVGEMVEETSEEILADLSKEALTLYREMQGEKAINMWEGDDWVTRYTMSALGGFLGGGLNTALTNLSGGYNAIKKFGTFEGTTNDAILSIAQDPEQIKLMNKILDKMPIASSTTSFEFDDFTKQYKTTQNYKESQDYALKQTLKNLVSYTEQALKQDGAYANKDSFLNCLSQTGRDSFIKAINLNNLRNTITLDYHFQHFKNLQHQLMDINTKISALEHQKKDSEKWTDNEKLTLDTYIEEKQNTLSQIKEYLDQKKMYDFAKTAIFEATPELNKAFKNKNFVTEGAYAEYRFGKSYKELNEVQKKIASEEYQNFKENENPEFVRAAHVIFENLLLSNQDSIKQQLNEDRSNVSKDEFYNTLEVLKFFNQNFDGENIEDYSTKINETLFDALNNWNKYQNIKQQILKDAFDLTNVIEDINKNFTISNETQQFLSGAGEQYSDEPYRIIDRVVEDIFGSLENVYQLINTSSYINPDLKEYFKQKFEKLPKVENPKSLDIQESNTYYSSKLELMEELLQSYLLSEFCNKLNSFDSFDPVHYAYAESLLKSTSINSAANQIITDTLNNFINKRKSVAFSFLQNFMNSSIQEESPLKLSLNTISKIHDFIYNKQTLDYTKLKLSKEEIDNLNQVKGQIEVFQSLLWALRKDNADKDNVKGYAPLLNNINKSLNLGNKELLEITQDQANLLIVDLNDYLKLIDNYIKIDDLNASQKLKQETSKRTKDIVGIIDYLQINLKDTELGNTEKLNELCPTICSFVEASKKPSFDKEKDYDISFEDQIKFVQEKEALENYIYELFHSDKFYDKEHKSLKEEALSPILNKLAEILEPKKFKHFNYASPVLSENKTILSFLNYLIRISTFKSSLFYNSYKEYLKENSDLAAIYEQEVNIHSALSAIVDPDYVYSFTNLINKTFCKKENIPDSYKKYFGFENIIFIEGFPGVGKTQGCIPQILKIIQKANPEILKNCIFAHISNENATEFTEKLKQKGFNIQPKTLTDVLEMFYSDYASYTVKGNITDTNNIIDFNVETGLSLKPNIQPEIVTNCPKIIFLDEFSRLTNIDSLLLEQAAKANGFIIVGTGDMSQIKNEAELKKPEEITLTNLPYNFYSAEKISLIMRAENNLIADALVDYQKVTDHNTFDEFDSFKYVQKDNVFAGVKCYKLSDFDQELDNLINKVMTNTDTLFIITSLDNLETYKSKVSNNPNIKVLTVEEAQGLEADYVIDTSPEYPYEIKDKLYTSFSRAKKGALLAASNFTSTKVNDFRKETLSEAFIKKTNQSIIQLYDSLTNKENISKNTFINQANKSLASKTEEKEKEENKGLSKEDAEQILKTLIDNSGEEIVWQKKENINKTIKTTSDNFKIINKESQYFIVVNYTDDENNEHNEEDLNTFLSIWEQQKIGDEDIDRGQEDSLEEPKEEVIEKIPLTSPTGNPQKSNVLTYLYSFTSIPKFPSDNIHDNRQDNWIGLQKLNLDKYNLKTDESQNNALGALLELQNIFFTSENVQSITQSLIKFFNTNISNKNLYDLSKLQLNYHVLHHHSNENSYFYREPDNFFNEETGNDKYPGTNLEVNIKDAKGTTIMNLTLVSLPNVLSYGRLLEKSEDTLDNSFIQNIYQLFGTDKKLLESFRKNKTGIWDYIQSNILNSTNISQDNKDKAQLFYILGSLFTTTEATFPLNDFSLEIDRSIKNEIYTQHLTKFTYEPVAQDLETVAAPYKTNGLWHNGCSISENVYIALKDYPEYGLTKGTHFIIYSNLYAAPRPEHLKFKGVNWYAVTPKPVTCKELISNLSQRLKNENNGVFYGHPFNTFSILKYVFENHLKNEQDPIRQRLNLKISKNINYYLNELEEVLKFVEVSVNTNYQNSSIKKSTRITNILNNLTLKGTNISNFTHRATISRILNSVLVNIFTDEQDAVDETLCQEIDELISKKKLAYISQFIGSSNNSSNVDGIYFSLGAFSKYLIKGRFERPVLSSTSFTDSLFNIIDKTTGELIHYSGKKAHSIATEDKEEPTYETVIPKVIQKLNLKETEKELLKTLPLEFLNELLSLNTKEFIQKLADKKILYLNNNNKAILYQTDKTITDIKLDSNNKIRSCKMDSEERTFIYQDNRILDRCVEFESININTTSNIEFNNKWIRKKDDESEEVIIILKEDLDKLGFTPINAEERIVLEEDDLFGNSEYISFTKEQFKNEFLPLEEVDSIFFNKLYNLVTIDSDTSNTTSSINLEENDAVFDNSDSYIGIVSKIENNEVRLKSSSNEDTIIAFNDLQNYKKLNEKCLNIINI